MHCLAKFLSTGVVMSSNSPRYVLQPQCIRRCVVFFSCSSSPPQMGKRLTLVEIAERRAKRVKRKSVNEDDVKEEKSDALFMEGLVRYYHRHYVIVEPRSTDPNSWPPNLEQTPEHILNSYMSALLKLYDGDIIKARKSPLLMTAAIPYMGMCSGGLRDEAEKTVKNLQVGTHDVLVFPGAIRVHNVVPSQISRLVSKALEKDFDLVAFLELTNLQYTRMEEGYYMMVCGHAARDERCGCKGPELLQWLKELASDAKKPLSLWTSSHYGGHRYAAACIVYPSGDWFGLLNDKDKAKRMLDAINDEDPLQLYELWRGRMALTPQDTHQAVKNRVKGVE
ncbi:unnamed protein product [Peronospora destructor]|uniref:Uncharacterized protein n=1 Tax=Peronospora destructor TaxID=86335 RepID=A0AAV0V4G3_9STRA|nr:unnamed protein product [Peronospora destructor]